MKINQNNKISPSGNKMPRFNIYWIWMALAVAILAWGILGNENVTHSTNWNSVKTMVEQGDVQKIIIYDKEIAEVFLKKEKVADYSSKREFQGISEQGPQFAFNVGSLDRFLDEVDQVQKEDGQDVVIEFRKSNRRIQKR